MLTREQIKAAWAGKRVPSVSVRNETFDSLKMANEAGGSLVIPTPTVHLNTDGFVKPKETDLYSQPILTAMLEHGLQLSWNGADHEFLNHNPHYFLFQKHSTKSVKKLVNGEHVTRRIPSRFVHTGNAPQPLYSNFGSNGSYQTEWQVSASAGVKTAITIDLMRVFGLGRLDENNNPATEDGKIQGIRYYLIVTNVPEGYNAGAVDDYLNENVDSDVIIARTFNSAPFAIAHEVANYNAEAGNSLPTLYSIMGTLIGYGITCHIGVEPRLQQPFPLTEQQLRYATIGTGKESKISGRYPDAKRAEFKFAIVCADPNNEGKYIIGGMSESIYVQPQYGTFNVNTKLLRNGDSVLLWDGDGWQKDLSELGVTNNIKVYYGWRARRK